VPDRGGARHLAEQNRTVGVRARCGPVLRAAPGQVLALRAGAPEGDPLHEAAQDRRALAVPGRPPGEVLALRAGAPEGGAADQHLQRAWGDDNADDRRGGGRRRHRGRSAPGHRGRLHGAQRHRADAEGASTGRAVQRAPVVGPRAHRDLVGAVEDIDQAGQGEAGLAGGRLGGDARRGRREGRVAAHVASCPKSCPQPGKVLRTRRKVESRTRFGALLRQLPEGA
jgi:hypothetical protein